MHIGDENGIRGEDGEQNKLLNEAMDVQLKMYFHISSLEKLKVFFFMQISFSDVVDEI